MVNPKQVNEVNYLQIVRPQHCRTPILRLSESFVVSQVTRMPSGKMFLSVFTRGTNKTVVKSLHEMIQWYKRRKLLEGGSIELNSYIGKKRFL